MFVRPPFFSCSLYLSRTMTRAVSPAHRLKRWRLCNSLLLYRFRWASSFSCSFVLSFSRLFSPNLFASTFPPFSPLFSALLTVESSCPATYEGCDLPLPDFLEWRCFPAYSRWLLSTVRNRKCRFSLSKTHTQRWKRWKLDPMDIVPIYSSRAQICPTQTLKSFYKNSINSIREVFG